MNTLFSDQFPFSHIRVDSGRTIQEDATSQYCCTPTIGKRYARVSKCHGYGMKISEILCLGFRENIWQRIYNSVL